MSTMSSSFKQHLLEWILLAVPFPPQLSVDFFPSLASGFRSSYHALVVFSGCKPLLTANCSDGLPELDPSGLIFSF
jgi:hypothetical protein